MTTAATRVEGLRTVSGSVERDLLFPTPETGQKVYNQLTDRIERWDGAAWTNALRSTKYSVVDYGAIAGDSSTATKAANAVAILAAIVAANTAGISDVVIPGGVYHCNPIVVPTLNFRISITGEGGGADQKSELRFYGAVGVGNVGGLDFRATSANITLRRLYISHDTSGTGGLAVAANGIGIMLTSAAYAVLEDLWVYQWGIGIQQNAGNDIYSSWIRVRCISNYTAGVQWNASLQNGNTFTACNFSQTIAGSGFVIVNAVGTASWNMSGCYFEGNSSYGFTMTGTGFLVLKFSNCYAEANGDWDYYINNGTAGSEMLVIFDGCYWDSANNGSNTLVQHRRVEVRGGKVRLENCRLFQMTGATTLYAEPPVRVQDAAGGLRGVQPCIAFNNEYETPELCTSMEGWTVLDSKHPSVGYVQGVSPVTLSIPALKAGSVHFNSLESRLPRSLGYLIKTSGKGVSASPTATATTSIGSPLVALNDTDHHINTGDIITVAGTTFNRTGATPVGSATEAYAKVINVLSNASVQVDGTAVSAVAGAAVAFRQGLAVELGVFARLKEDLVVTSGNVTAWTPQGTYTMFMISETVNVGHTSIWILANGDIYLVFQSDGSARFVKDNTFGTATKINVGYAGGDIEIKNNLVATCTFTVTELVNR